MNSLNSILIEGNLVRDPVFKTTPKGTAVCTFTLAANRFYKQESGESVKETSFFDVESWARLAEACRDKGVKGRGVRVVGRLKQSRWTDAEGKNHSKVSIIAEHLEFRPVVNKDEEKAAASEAAPSAVEEAIVGAHEAMQAVPF